MSKKIIISTTIMLSLAASIILTTLTFAQTEANKKVHLQMSSNKDEYVLGEPIQINGEYINDTNKDAMIYLGRTNGILLAYGEDYKYFDAAPTDCSVPMPFQLKAGERYKTSDKPYNYKNVIFLLNAIGDRQPAINCDGLKRLERAICIEEREKPVHPKYAFQDVGTYYAKFGGFLITDEKNEKTEPITTETVKITIVEPTRDDLEVWKIIGGEDRHTFADLMRSGWVDYNIKDEAKKTAFVNQVEQILIDYPNSTYSTYLRDGLKNYRAKEIEKVRAAEKAKEKAKP
jgi:hypothetical protein